MLSPNLISILCALFLSVPLTIFFLTATYSPATRSIGITAKPEDITFTAEESVPVETNVNSVPANLNATGKPNITSTAESVPIVTFVNPAPADLNATAKPNITSTAGESIPIETFVNPAPVDLNATAKPNINSTAGESIPIETLVNPAPTDLNATAKPNITSTAGESIPIETLVNPALADLNATGKPNITSTAGESIPIETLVNPALADLNTTAKPNITSTAESIPIEAYVNPAPADLNATAKPNMTSTAESIPSIKTYVNPKLADVNATAEPNITSTPESIPIKTHVNPVPADLNATAKPNITFTAESIPIKTNVSTEPANPNATTTTTTLPLQSAPPSIRVDYEEDELLLQNASKTNPNPKANTPNKIAFMFLTTTSLPLSQLWQLYFNATPTDLYSVYVHADPSFSPLNISGVFSDRFVPSKPTCRNTPTLISAMRRILAHALLDDPTNSHFALLSASCIPLHSFNFTYTTITSSNKSFVEVLDREGSAYGRWASRGKDVMLPEVPFESFRIGSQFWVMTRRHATMVVSDRRLWTKFKLPCLHWYDCYPEESYFSTLLNMADPHGIVPATLTHVDWWGMRNGHPRTYEPDDVKPEVISRLRSDRPRYGDDRMNITDPSTTKRRHDPFLFARKFSPTSVEQLMNIAKEVLFKED